MNLRPFKKVLIANRGEIAVRIVRACHELGLAAVAVFSEADAEALHVRVADESVCIGPAPSSQSYLRADRLLEVAAECGCDAVHPGYGFMSENAGFAQAVLDAGLVWIGPPPAAIRDMGSKTGARQRMQAAGVPLVPGTVEALKDLDDARTIAAGMGYPVLLKASAGGGGKGMRAVWSEDELESGLNAAKGEALKSFGDDEVYVEKLVLKPRHVEIQVLADGHGNVVHLFERDCSIQRRHQKVVEEAPCPMIETATRDAMAQAAVQAAKAVDYVGAGTCEFLLAADGAFYFLEMNTRLQVEHPITEAITGIDLVVAQLRIAAGETLWLEQSDLQVTGHAIELRIYAEDATAGFRPAPGPLHGYREPAGPGVRVDSGVVEGMEVPIHYDPMVAKLVVWGSDRKAALGRAAQALRHYHLVGIPTSIPFFLAVLQDEEFIAGRYDTSFISPEWLEANVRPPVADTEAVAVAAAIARFEKDLRGSPSVSAGPAESAWKRSGRWKSTHRGGI